MKSNTLFILLFLFSISLFSQKDIRFKNNPPGTIKLNDSLFIDVAPVDNLMYLEFVKSLKNFWSLDVHKKLKGLNSYGLDIKLIEKNFNSKLTVFNLDELIKEDSTIASITKNNKYFNHPKYSLYPVVNISKNDAELYCKWRTDMVMLNWAIKSKDQSERSEYPNKIKYRLPTVSEYNNVVKLFGFLKNKLKDDDIQIKPFRNKYKKKYKKAMFLKDNISEYSLDSLPVGFTNFKSKNNDTGFRCVCEIIKN